MALQVRQRVGAERAEVGHAPTVGRQLRAVALGLVPGLEFGLLAADIAAEQVHLGHAHFFLIVQETHAAGVDVQAALDTAPTGGLHATPVLERLGHQAPGGDGDDGLVEVLHLHRVQGDIHHIAIGADLGHFDPVTDAQHVVAGQLHTGDERQQGVLVHQQNHRRHRTQA